MDRSREERHLFLNNSHVFFHAGAQIQREEHLALHLDTVEGLERDRRRQRAAAAKKDILIFFLVNNAWSFSSHNPKLDTTFHSW